MTDLVQVGFAIGRSIKTGLRFQSLLHKRTFHISADYLGHTPLTNSGYSAMREREKLNK